jgi:hypothetical protein
VNRNLLGIRLETVSIGQYHNCSTLEVDSEHEALPRCVLRLVDDARRARAFEWIIGQDED